MNPIRWWKARKMRWAVRYLQQMNRFRRAAFLHTRRLNRTFELLNQIAQMTSFGVFITPWYDGSPPSVREADAPDPIEPPSAVHVCGVECAEKTADSPPASETEAPSY